MLDFIWQGLEFVNNVQIIVTTTHTTKKGGPKILAECVLPLTGKGVVKKIITELAGKITALYLRKAFSIFVNALLFF